MSDYFLGALTPKGFTSYFNEIIDYKKGNRLYILKGGSGLGKSTFLKKVASRCKKRGHTVTNFYCSNSPESLDGIRIDNLGFAVIDGTAPHMVDALAYGVFDEIINLGESIENIDKNIFDDVKKIQATKACINASIQNYLQAAFCFYTDTHCLYECALNKASYNKLFNDLAKQFEPNCGIGTLENVFISSFTKDGVVSFLKTVGYKKATVLNSGFLSVNSRLLKKLLDHLINLGYDCIKYSNNFEPKYPIGIYVKDLEFLIYSTSFFEKTILNNSEIINMDDVFSKNLLNTAPLLNNISFIENILNHCYNKMLSANLHHEALEKLFIPFVNFGNNERELEKLLKKELR